MAKNDSKSSDGKDALNASGINTNGSPVLEDLLKQGALESPYVLTNTTMNTDQIVELFRHARRTNSDFKEVMTNAAENYSKKGIDFQENLLTVIPKLEKELGNSTLAAIAVYDYFKNQKQRIETPKISVIRSVVEDIRGKYNGLREFISENANTGINLFLVLGVLSFAGFGIRICYNSVVENSAKKEKIAKIQEEQKNKRYTRIINSDSLSSVQKVDSLRETIFEIFEKVEKNYSGEGSKILNMESVSKNEMLRSLSVYVVENRLPVNTTMNVLEKILAIRKNNCSTSFTIQPSVEAALSYMTAIKEKGLCDKAVYYLDKTDANCNPMQYVLNAARLFDGNVVVPKETENKIKVSNSDSVRSVIFEKVAKFESEYSEISKMEDNLRDESLRNFSSYVFNNQLPVYTTMTVLSKILAIRSEHCVTDFTIQPSLDATLAYMDALRQKSLFNKAMFYLDKAEPNCVPMQYVSGAAQQFGGNIVIPKSDVSKDSLQVKKDTLSYQNNNNNNTNSTKNNNAAFAGAAAAAAAAVVIGGN
ncbi:MAG: hypothetical protein WC755_03015 [Candidatus Woesearchaeota archaeon]|jgi:hypothetical protein